LTDSVKRSDALDNKIEGSSDVKYLMNLGKHNRRMIHVLAISLILDFMLTIALGFLALQVNASFAKANSVERRAYEACLSANQARATQRQLWGYILALPPSAPRTSEQDRQVEQFKIYIQKVFAPRKC
jgi:hypothetical protein